MHRDFTEDVYCTFLKSFKDNNYNIISFDDYIKVTPENSKILVLRHDVDKKPKNALKLAILEKELGVSATYFFKFPKGKKWHKVIRLITASGHKVGYHYSDLANAKGNYEKAITSFEQNLRQLREFYPVKAICMDGNPLSKWDNKDLWKKYNYHDFGIEIEPYLDIDYRDVLYLTDTGRRWNGEEYNVRDKVKSGYNFNFKTTFDIMASLQKNELPDKIIMNAHPERWKNSIPGWAEEYISQNLRNFIKKYFFVK